MLDTEEYHAGSFFIDVHVVRADEAPLETDSTGGYVMNAEGVALYCVGRDRWDALPEPWFSDTFTKVVRNEDGTFAPTDVTDSLDAGK